MASEARLQKDKGALRAVLRPKFLAAFLVNQVGSLQYYRLLGTLPLAVASPACNAAALAVKSDRHSEFVCPSLCDVQLAEKHMCVHPI